MGKAPYDQWTSPNSARRVKRAIAGSRMSLVSPISIQAWAISCCSISCNTQAKPARNATSTQHGMGRERAGQTKRVHPGIIVPTFSTAHATLPTSPTAKRLMRRGRRSAQENRRSAGTKRTASCAKASIMVASRRYARRIVFNFIACHSERIIRTSRCVTKVSRNGVTSRAKVSASTSWRRNRR